MLLPWRLDTSCAPLLLAARCILAMFFKRLKSSGKFYTYFSNVKQRVNFQNSNSVFEVCKSYSGLHFWLNNQAFVIALNKVPKTKNAKHRAYEASNDVNRPPLAEGG